MCSSLLRLPPSTSPPASRWKNFHLKMKDVSRRALKVEIMFDCKQFCLFYEVVFFFHFRSLFNRAPVPRKKFFSLAAHWFSSRRMPFPLARPLLVVLEENSRDLFALRRCFSLISSNIQAHYFLNYVTTFLRFDIHIKWSAGSKRSLQPRKKIFWK